MHNMNNNALHNSSDASYTSCLHYAIHKNKPFMMDDMFIYHASHLFEHWIFCANHHKHVHIIMDDVYIYHAHTIFPLPLFCVGTYGYSSTSQSHELTKRALESNDDLGSLGMPISAPFPSRKDFAHFFYLALTRLWAIYHFSLYAHFTMFTLHVMSLSMLLPCNCDPCLHLHMLHHSTTTMCICMLGGDTSCYCHVLCVPHDIANTLLMLCVRAYHLSCAIRMPTIHCHDMITMITCFVASPMIHSCSFHWVDSIYVHASHMICLDHCHLSPLVASLIFPCSECNHAMLIDIEIALAFSFMLGDLDILLVKHACLNELNVFGCARIHMLPYHATSLVPSYDKNDEDTCWVSHHMNDRFCIHANLICFSKCWPCSFVLKVSQGGAVMRHIGHGKPYTMSDTNIFGNIHKVNSFPLSHLHMRILNGPHFHCCFLLLVYMIHLMDGGATLEIGSMEHQVEERSVIDHSCCRDAPTLGSIVTGTTTHATTSSNGTNQHP